MADISWTEILIAISISIILIFIGCLILGLHVQSIKNNINTNKFNVDSSIGKISDEATIRNNNLNNVLNQINSNINVQSKSNIDIVKQLGTLSNIGSSNISTLDAQIKLVNDSIAKLQNGSNKFSSLSIQDSYIKVSNDAMRVGGKNAIYMDANKLFLNSNSCLLFGSNELCSSNNDFKLNHVKVNNMQINNMNMSTSNNILNLRDEKGSPYKIESSGIIQQNKGSMIDFQGNGIGKFSDGMRVYIPGNITRNKIALSYFDNDEFIDILSVEKSKDGSSDTAKVMGDLVIQGNIYNSNMAEFVDYIFTEIHQLKMENSELKQDILQLKLN